jgi:hypothetical protein
MADFNVNIDNKSIKRDYCLTEAFLYLFGILPRDELDYSPDLHGD